MAEIPLGTPQPQASPQSGFALFALGFRPFFLLAGMAAVVLLGLWLFMWTGHLSHNGYYGGIGWHSHEMLFGYSVAVIAGFLLTAVRNWTGIDTPSGGHLAFLAAVWVLGRLMPFATPPVPPIILTIVDLSFAPLVGVALYRPLMKGGNKVNRVFLLLLFTMAAANLLIHLQALGISSTADRGVTLMLNLILLLITFIGGRVMPFFTERAIPGAKTRLDPALERYAYVFLFAFIVLELLYPVPWLAGAVAAGVGITQAMRLAGWYNRRIWSIPILWVLHIGYIWLVLGFFLKTAAATGWFAPSVALHAHTIGAIGIMTLGMMARVALGHTGRELRTHTLVNWAFILLNLTAVLRVFGPAIMPSAYTTWVQVSGGLWVISFLLFLVVYFPILMRPRVDGRPDY